jgi:hypothetical protein
VQPQHEINRDQEHQADDGDGAVLTRQISPRALLYRQRDFLHAGVARILTQDPAARPKAINHRDDAACHCKP